MFNKPLNPQFCQTDVSGSTFLNADCFDVFPFIEDNSIDAIICDLPYGTTNCKWDTVLPFDKLWAQYERVIKPNGAIVLFGRNPFFAQMICSNEKMFKYKVIWDKNAGTDFAQANNKPITVHENIALFCNGRINYNRIEDEGFLPYSDKRTTKLSSELGAKGLIKREPFENKTTRTPTTIRKVFPDNRKGLGSSLHQTQKPINLMEWLVKSYTNEGDTVLDNTMGSGTTNLACIKLNRKSIGIEKEKQYFDIAVRRASEYCH
jgi:site-specific DNA-methyltransferase (adenine-specific)